MTRRTWIALTLVLVVLAVALPRLRSEKKAAASSPERTSPPPRVEVFTVVPERIAESLVTPGTLVANERTDVTSEAAGKIERIFFEEGRRVGGGELLVKIDDRELVAERERIRSRLELADRRTARQEELHGDGLISDDQLDTVNTEADVLRAELGQIEARLAKTEIRAPFPGVVGLRRVSVGAFISPQTRITTLVEVDPIKLDFSVPERYSDRFFPGKSVSFSVEGMKGSRQATIYAIEPMVDPETRTIPIRARCRNPDGWLVPGGFADVTLDVRTVENALTVPNMAVVPELGGKKVYVVVDGLAEARQVETGIRTGDRIEITRGIVAGDRVIVSGLQFVRAGAPVEVTPGSGEETAADLGRATL